MNGKREMIRELTQSAWSILQKYENDERDGLLTREQAQQTALSRIQYLRYGDEGKDYFWVTDMQPVMMMHPHRSDLNGQDLRDFTDPAGNRMFVKFVETVEKSTYGYVDYMWQWKDDSLHIVPKLSFVKHFEPWDWVIGTGIYIEDVKKEISALTKRMISISIGISILIAFMLMYLIKQGLQIERKKTAAEHELQESREKYRTLVEAATEGLIMLVNGKISFSNAVISKLTGFSPDELRHFTIKELISKNNNQAIIETFSKNSVKAGRYELNLAHKEGGFAEVLITASTTKFYGKFVNIIIVKDVSADHSSELAVIDYPKLLSNLNLGFFKAKIDTKGCFLYANPSTLNILGYDSLDELSNEPILGMLTEKQDRNDLRKALVKEGFVKNKVLRIRRKNRHLVYVNVSLVVLNEVHTDELICDGMIEDISQQQTEKAEQQSMIASLKSACLWPEQAVRAFMLPAHQLHTEASLSDAVKAMNIHQTSCLLITQGHQHLGILTKTDIQERILGLKLKMDNPVYLVMSSPLVSIPDDFPLGEAMQICQKHHINHLAVKDQSGKLIGVFHTELVYQNLLNNMRFYLDEIEAAQSPRMLASSHSKLQTLVSPLIQSEIHTTYISRLITLYSDAISKRIIALGIEACGPPPAAFAFIAMGSEGRKEETLLTDQDNALVYEDIPKGQEDLVKAYFLQLGEYVCTALDHVGYAFCKGKVMASNPQWCKPLSEWKKHFVNWISKPEPKNLLDASIFFDLRFVYGEEKLVIRLQDTITAAIGKHPLFCYHMALNTYNTKVNQISTGNILTGEHSDTLDLKLAMIPITMFARTYALKHALYYTNTLERLQAMHERNIIHPKTLEEMMYAFNILMQLRLKNQLRQIDQKQPPSNTLDTSHHLDFEVYVLKRVLSLIPNYQQRIKQDFSLNV